MLLRMGLRDALGGRVADLASEEVSESFVGGARLNGLDASWPLVRLELCTSGLRLRPRKVLQRIMPIWEASYSELTSVRASGRMPPVFSGVRFRVGNEAWAIFWTPRKRKVIEALAGVGVSVDETPIPRPFLDPGGNRESSAS